MKNVIRLGDATSHGGKVISASAAHFKVHGIPVACVGDTCSCPLPGIPVARSRPGLRITKSTEKVLRSMATV